MNKRDGAISVSEVWSQYQSESIPLQRLRYVLVNDVELQDLIETYSRACELITHLTFAVQTRCPGVRINYSPKKHLLTDTDI